MRRIPIAAIFGALPPSLLLLSTCQVHPACSQHIPQAPQRPDRLPTAIRKMSVDEDAKFWPGEYWSFEEMKDGLLLEARDGAASGRSADGVSHGSSGFIAERFFGPPPDTDPRPHLSRSSHGGNSSFALLAPIAVHDLSSHTDAQEPMQRHLGRRAHDAPLHINHKRQFACPLGTTSCADINFPNSCCVAGETCFVVRDTGLGPVGCCPAGASCSGSLAGCPADHTPCSSDLGGGCCIPGFICAGVGCVPAGGGSGGGSSGGNGGGDVVITTTQTTIVPGPAPSTVIVTVIITLTASGGGVVTRSTTQTVTQTLDQVTTEVQGNQPLRPVSSTISVTRGPTNPADACPPGYYGCLARASGGCCRVGRECDTARCPAPESYTTIVDQNGVTVVVPLPLPDVTGSAGTCADGWFLCGDEGGPVQGCCPSGYACGTASCTASFPEGTATVAKVLPGRNDATSLLRCGGVASVVAAALVVGWTLMM